MRKFLITDVDETISSFNHSAGVAAIRQHLCEKYNDNLAEHVCSFMEKFNSAFMERARERNAAYANELDRLIREAAVDIVKNPSDCSDLHWSRELWVHISSQLFDGLSPLSCFQAAGSFWNGIAEATQFYPDAYNFLVQFIGENALKPAEERWRLVFVTSSDARLRYDAAQDQLVYAPDFAKVAKFSRMPFRHLPDSYRAFNFFIGDPVSKPHPQFWQKVAANIDYDPANDLAIMIGDSYQTDLTGLGTFGVIPVLLDREEKNYNPSDFPEAKHIIKSFAELPNIMAWEVAERKIKGRKQA